MMMNDHIIIIQLWVSLFIVQLWSLLFVIWLWLSLYHVAVLWSWVSKVDWDDGRTGSLPLGLYTMMMDDDIIIIVHCFVATLLFMMWHLNSILDRWVGKRWGFAHLGRHSCRQWWCSMCSGDCWHAALSSSCHQHGWCVFAWWHGIAMAFLLQWWWAMAVLSIPPLILPGIHRIQQNPGILAEWTGFQVEFQNSYPFLVCRLKQTKTELTTI